MKKILLLYFSGAGATKSVAQRMQAFFSRAHGCAADVFPANNACGLPLEGYHALVIGTPVYHGAPSRLIQSHIGRLSPLARPVPAFLYNTYALCSCNTNRILAKQLRDKNIFTIQDRSYRSPASDGVLLTPFVQRFYQFEKGIARKIAADCGGFLKLLENNPQRGYIPRFRLSSIVNAPNKLAGQHITFPIYLHPDRCVKCGKCVRDCPHRALEKSGLGHPQLSIRKCENCYRCVHHCPAGALSLRKRRAPTSLLAYGENGDALKIFNPSPRAQGAK